MIRPDGERGTLGRWLSELASVVRSIGITVRNLNNLLILSRIMPATQSPTHHDTRRPHLPNSRDDSQAERYSSGRLAFGRGGTIPTAQMTDRCRYPCHGMARLDRAIVLCLVLMPITRPGRVMTGRGFDGWYEFGRQNPGAVVLTGPCSPVPAPATEYRAISRRSDGAPPPFSRTRDHPSRQPRNTGPRCSTDG
jgi:hypothetical protein